MPVVHAQHCNQPAHPGVFGAAQQLRGAHFLSHDLWAAAICWTVAVVTAAVWPPAPARCA